MSKNTKKPTYKDIFLDKCQKYLNTCCKSHLKQNEEWFYDHYWVCDIFTNLQNMIRIYNYHLTQEGISFAFDNYTIINLTKIKSTEDIESNYKIFTEKVGNCIKVLKLYNNNVKKYHIISQFEE